ncbi:short-chain dehydrogenase/reductase SDR [Gordonia bronchialis DSM 43247]|uniref:Short-chain dehydrogenase/reductase SDR n=1 Tax=Gordonia bronchialis (strain ATCC 25592 / DSM 43247 / BCRC 13721 / JCM 3198 / KCTC 3076 / NBRC 16047 / NCTC 10667) TaxID=526226 RepID=D0L5U6_GORB4|nr:short-chain dehydrogenase/reductase SDR [Gordonia bronchialis DSM 43247]STQ66428.1 2-(R)-hydroxypropyl-CoM dehydrogenase [Gordonia bronchialis]
MVITGAGSGMGRALALRLSRCGVTLALTDLDTRSVEDTAHHCVSRGAAIVVHRLDVADEAAVRAYADAMVERHGAPSMVFNNAVTTMVAGVLDEDTDYARRIMDVNWSGVMYGTNAFRDHLENGGGGRIVNTSSAFGLFGSPMQPSYCASKFAVRGFSEGVQAELRVADSPVRLHIVYPGAVHTAIARDARYPVGDIRDEVVNGFDHRLPGTRPAAAATAILAGVLAGRDRIMVGLDARAIDLATRAGAGAIQRPIATVIGPVVRPVLTRRHRRAR